MHKITIIDTMPMLMDFEAGFGYTLCEDDRLELFKQLFFILDQHTPLDMYDRNILTYDNFIFANHLRVDREAIDRLAYHLLVAVWDDIRHRGFYIDGALMYFPFSMQGWDLCVRRYKD